jgi:Glyoxalase/Bleomycin resistance protein/Dioxygenase superfamily
VPTEEGIGWWFRLDSLQITLLPNAAEPSPSKFPDHAMPMLWLEVDDLAAAARRFARHRVKVIDFHEEQMMIIADPDGIQIEVWQAEARSV